MFCTFAGMAPLTLDLKLCNFITPQELFKTPQNIIQGSFSIKPLKFLNFNTFKFSQQVTNDFLQRATFATSNEQILKQVTSNFLQRVTSTTNKEANFVTSNK